MQLKEPHPLTKLIPETADQDALAIEIAQDGLRDPVILYEGKIIEGRVRYRAWFQIAPIVNLGRGRSGQHGPPTRDWVLDHDGDVLDWMVRRYVEQYAPTGLDAIKLAAAVLPHYRAMRGQTEKRLYEALGGVISWNKIRALNGLEEAGALDRVLSGEQDIYEAARTIGLASDKRGIALGKSYGAGDKFDQAILPLKRYLAAWKRKNYEFRHVPPKEASRRLLLIDSAIEELQAMRLDIARRAVEARLSAPPERKVRE